MQLLAILFGAIIGSFANLCIDRLPRGESLLRPASHCDACGRRLRLWHLVPLVSYAAARGRCGSCGVRIPWRAPLVELLLAAGYGFAAARFGATPQALLVMLYLTAFVMLFFIDLEQGILPNKVIVTGAVAGLTLSLLVPEQSLLNALAGAAVGFGVMLALYWAARGGLGEGDVKLAGLIGLATGLHLLLPALVLAAIAGGLVAAVLLLMRRVRFGQTVPFGPFLSAGACTSLLWGPNLMQFWTHTR